VLLLVLGWIFFGAWSVKTINNKNNNLQQKQQHTQQSTHTAIKQGVEFD
jgi:Tfp pilus assembly protein PilN